MDASTKTAFRISATYLLLGGLWILLSDQLVSAWVDADQLSAAQTVKGWLFMLAVATLLFSWVRRELYARERSQKTLRATEANLAILLDQAITGVFVIRDGRFVYVNDRLGEIFGYEPAELIGRTAASLVHEGERARVMARLARTDGRRPRQLFGFRGVRSDGSLVHTEAQTTRTELDGEPVVLGMLLDVTQRKVMEGQYQAARRLEAVGRMAGGVAHDFNNLLTAVAGAAELLRAREDMPAGCEEDLQVILDTSERGAVLLRQLLAFSRNRAQHAEPIDVARTIAGMQPLLRRLVHARIQLDVRLDDDAPAILADRHQIEQVVLNLVINARDAMPEGGTLRIRAGPVDAKAAPAEARVITPGDQLMRFTIEDTGIGIAREVRGRIFEPFFTTKGEKGTGLGLATVQAIIAQTGGHIMVDSEPGRTCFAVYFPTTDQPASDDSTPPIAPDCASEQRGRVLVVEDEAVVRAITRRALEKAGFAVVEASDGAAARAHFDQLAEFSAVLLDVSLPDESGADIARAIAAHEDAPPIVLMSGYDLEDVSLPDDVTPFAFVEKPFTLDEIASAVTRASAQRASASS